MEKRALRLPAMKRQKPKRKEKLVEPKRPPSRFAPSAFLTGSPSVVQQLCEDLANQAKARFDDLTGTTWTAVGNSIVEQLRASGHDLMSFDEAEGLQEWKATWHHPRGIFSLFLSFRAPASVEVTWTTEAATFSARA
jgi:hypothetical protein